MNTKYRKTIIAGNWKMNMLSSDVKPFIEELKPLMPKIKKLRDSAVRSCGERCGDAQGRQGSQDHDRRAGCVEV